MHDVPRPERERERERERETERFVFRTTFTIDKPSLLGFSAGVIPTLPMLMTSSIAALRLLMCRKIWCGGAGTEEKADKPPVPASEALTSYTQIAAAYPSKKVAFPECSTV